MNQTAARSIIPVSGMHCASCAARIEKTLSKLPGVATAVVNFAFQQARVEYNPQQLPIEDIYAVIEQLGYGVKKGAVSPTGEADEEALHLRQVRVRLWVAWLFTAPLTVIMLLDMFFGLRLPGYQIIELVLAIPVIFWAGIKTHRSSFFAAKHLTANMDTLITLGTFAAYSTGIAAFLYPIESYAGVGAMIMAFHLVGKYLETISKGRASQAIKKLLKLEVKSARLLMDGKEWEVPIQEVQAGNIMLVKPGEKIPTDGEVIEGESWVDESLVTGESTPVAKKEGDQVIGTTINQRGALKVRATRVGQDTFLAQVIRLVKECQGTKVPIQQFADRVTGYFVPVILLIAILTLVLWLSFPDFFIGLLIRAGSSIPWINPDLGAVSLGILAMVAVLVIACPCALGLATPTALMIGSGLGAEHGILIRSGEAIQTMKGITTMVFDKTGTLTSGQPTVSDIITVEGFDESRLLQLAASLEAFSEHPLAQPIVKLANEKQIKLTPAKKFEALTGLGVRAELDGKQAMAGSPKMMEQYGILTLKLNERLKALEEEAKTIILVSVDKELAGAIAVADTLKNDAESAIAEIIKMGIEPVMLTGDNQRTARAVAQKLGIKRVLAEVLPDQKLEEIKRLQAQGEQVAMVGDGINDAPALSQANVGIAIGSGTDIAIESSDITLVRGNLGSVVTAVKLSQATFKKIKQNLFWAFFYNTVAIPAAMLGLLHPVIAEIAMAASSLNVVGNSLRLKKALVSPPPNLTRLP